MTKTTRKTAAREPLRTFKELAVELGLTASQLSGRFSTSPVAPPKPVYPALGKSRQSYYLPSAVRAWWVAHQQATRHGGSQHGAV